ncbi:MAG: gamma-glutamyltransferase family protein, partial [Gammaproteobacteria bacterium]|nr:gamma-glutamyltransferase family protein [Gammaproteobacteria bacterium]
GHGSVAVPGGLAALDQSWRQYGSLPWKKLIEPSIETVRAGFPMGKASYIYLQDCYEPVYGWHADGRKALVDENNELKKAGGMINIPQLADSLEQIANEGASAMYTGDVARLIIADMEANEGAVTARDLAEYQPVQRTPLHHRMGEWLISTNPPPAVGGVTLCAMLALMGHRPDDGWTPENVAFAAQVQQAVLTYRSNKLDLSDNIESDAKRFLEICAQQDPAALSSPSTIHVSAVDKDGLACSLTMSSGYGSGVMPPGTGIWLNNSLGELELNRRGLVVGPPGQKLISNMAPSVARSDSGGLLAIGSPGANRITTALMMTLLNLFRLGMTLEKAIAQPRMHFEINSEVARLSVEPGLDTREVTLPLRVFDEQSMFFGGVGAAQCLTNGELHAAADSRRTGGARVVG